MPKAGKAAKAALPQFKQYREADGQFYFKLVAVDGQVLLQSKGFTAPKDAGQSIAQLQSGGAAQLAQLHDKLQAIEGVSEEQVIQALQTLQEAAQA